MLLVRPSSELLTLNDVSQVSRRDVIHTTSLSTKALSFVTSCFLTNIRLTTDQRVSCTDNPSSPSPSSLAYMSWQWQVTDLDYTEQHRT